MSNNSESSYKQIKNMEQKELCEELFALNVMDMYYFIVQLGTMEKW